MTIAISTTIDIAATSEAVWDVLTDFGSYSRWNSFTVEGSARKGTKLVVHMPTTTGRGMSFKPTVLTAERARELRWLGTLGSPRFLSGEHFFTLTANDDGTTRLTHGENYSGVSVSLLKHTLSKKKSSSSGGYEAFNTAIKQRVETSYPTR